MKKSYKSTMCACFTGYIVQAIINNFAPLLFVTFQKTFDIPLSQITALITVNFVIQLLIDLLSAGFIDKIGYRASAVLSHVFAAVGLILLTILPEVFASPFVGLLIAVIIYAVGGGLLEVLVSPIMEACPTENKEKAMSLLHSFYCWGHMAVVLLSTLFFYGFRYIKLENISDILGFNPNSKRHIFYTGTYIFFAGGRGKRINAKGTLPQQGLLANDDNDGVFRSQRTGSKSMGVNICGARSRSQQNRR